MDGVSFVACRGHFDHAVLTKPKPRHLPRRSNTSTPERAPPTYIRALFRPLMRRGGGGVRLCNLPWSCWQGK